MRTTLRAAVTGLSLLLLLSLVGCPFSPDQDDGQDPPKPPSFKARTSPENLLYNLREAYSQREAAEYESLLATNFTFVLSEEDAGEPGMPDEWGRGQEIQVHQRMFDASMVQNLTLDFEIGERVFDQTAQRWTIMITNVALYLFGVTPIDETPQEYAVQGARSKFWFQEESWNATGTETPVWTIVRWEDSPIES